MNNNRCIIISDTHHRTNIVDKVLKKEKWDKVIFLGDYFDDFYDSPTDARRTAKWLKKIIHDEDKVFLMGNHDLSYYKNNSSYHTKCSGWTLEKHEAINSVLDESDWNKLKWFVWEQGWLITHAGLSLKYLQKYSQIPKYNKTYITSFLKSELKNVESHIEIEEPNRIFMAGRARGGGQSVGGITWCDFNVEFAPIPDIKQIFGHTIVPEPQCVGDNWNLDTNSCEYGILTDGKLEIKEA